ncbi:MAG: hypothetical protein ACOH13_08165 [Flavobacteriales bacterium]
MIQVEHYQPQGTVLNDGIEKVQAKSHLRGMKVEQACPAAALREGGKKKPKTADSPKGADIATGIVKFLVDVVDETGETVAIATILTMVRKLDQKG